VLLVVSTTGSRGEVPGERKPVIRDIIIIIIGTKLDTSCNI
jgi:hypothetical protein